MFDYTNDDDMLPYNHLDPEEINDIQDATPIDLTEVPF